MSLNRILARFIIPLTPVQASIAHEAQTLLSQGKDRSEWLLVPKVPIVGSAEDIALLSQCLRMDSLLDNGFDLDDAVALKGIWDWAFSTEIVDAGLLVTMDSTPEFEPVLDFTKAVLLSFKPEEFVSLDLTYISTDTMYTQSHVVNGRSVTQSRYSQEWRNHTVDIERKGLSHYLVSFTEHPLNPRLGPRHVFALVKLDATKHKESGFLHLHAVLDALTNWSGKNDGQVDYEKEEVVFPDGSKLTGIEYDSVAKKHVETLTEVFPPIAKDQLFHPDIPF